MKQFAYIAFILVIAGLLIAPSYAADVYCFPDANNNTYDLTTGSVATWFSGGTANHAAICTACGFPTTPRTYTNYEHHGTSSDGLMGWPYPYITVLNGRPTAFTYASGASLTISATSNLSYTQMSCGATSNKVYSGWHWRSWYADTNLYPVDFNATITNGSAPLTTTFHIIQNASFINATGTTWSFGDGNVTTSTATSINHRYENQGTYTVIAQYTNKQDSSKTITKLNYITVGSPNATSTTFAVARDLYTGFAINGAQVNMRDVENASWTNTTTTNGVGSITTLLGHTIDIWGSATGYEDDNLIGVPETDGGYYSLLLRPTNLTTYNATPGNLTLAVTVQDLQIPHQTLSGAEVTAAWGAQYASGISNAAGSVFFTVPNNTAIHLSAFKSGYASGSSTHITGSANGGSAMETAIVYIGTDYVTPTPSVTLTTGPGGTVPQTVDPYPCIGDGSPTDTANCQRKQGSMAAGLISNGPALIEFFIALTIIGGLMLITGKR